MSVFGHTKHTTGRGNFNTVGAILVALAHGFASFFRTVNYSFFRAWVAAQIIAHAIGGVGMAARSGDALFGGKDSGAWDFALIYRITDTHIDACATEIAHSGKPCE